jgi:hypothetical protein
MPIINPSDPTTLTTAALNAAEASINLSLIGTTPAPPLSAARSAKSGLVAGIFNSLRVQPIAYTVGSNAYTWDASDESINALNGALIAGVITALGSSFTDLATNLSSMLYGLQAEIGGSTYNGPSSFTAEPVLGSVSWTPIGATAPVTLTAAQAQGLLAAIAARRATLQGLRLTQQAAIAACTTVAQVIALSVSSGWGTD